VEPAPPTKALPRPAAVAVGCAAVATWGFIAFYLAHWGSGWALDLRVYRAAAADLLDHGSPYTTTYTSSHLLFTYPPLALLLFTPLSFGSLPLVKALWWLVNEAALTLVLWVALEEALSMPRRRALLFATGIGAVATIALEPLRSNLDYGQINLILMALVVFDLLRVRGRGRGILVGIAAAIKLTPLIYVAYFFVSRDRRSVVRSVVTFVGVSALSWAILPSESARYWLHDAFSPGRTGHPANVSNQSWNGLFHRAPFHAGAVGVALWAVVSLLTVAVCVVVAHHFLRRSRGVDALLALALGELLVSPISWSHHWSWLVLAPVALWSSWGRDRPAVAALAFVLGVALAEPYWWPVGGWPGALLADSLTLAGAGLLGVLAWEAWRDRGAGGRALPVALLGQRRSSSPSNAPESRHSLSSAKKAIGPLP
jgi:alpha-1,2-mannosyltransferase